MGFNSGFKGLINALVAKSLPSSHCSYKRRTHDS